MLYPSNHSKQANLSSWRQDRRLLAISALMLAGEPYCLSGKQLSVLLGIKPHGLRQMLVRPDGYIVAEWRESGADPRGETWFRYDITKVPPQQRLPRLMPKLLPAPRIDGTDDQSQSVTAPRRRRGSTTHDQG